MTEWVNFAVVGNNLVEYLLGSYAIFSVIICAGFLITLMVLGMEFKYSFPLTLPIVALFSLAGWFGNTTWVLNAVLLTVGLVYAFAIIKIIGR